MLERYGLSIPDELRNELDELRRLRNSAAHGRLDPTADNVTAGIAAIKKFELWLADVDMDVTKQKAAELARDRLQVREQREQQIVRAEPLQSDDKDVE